MGTISRKILILGVLTLSLGVCHQVTSYTMAKVENSVNLTISSPESALIGVNDKSGITVTKRLKEITKKTTTICRVLGVKKEDIDEELIENENSNDKFEVLEEKIVNTEVTKETLLEGIDYNGHCFTIINNMNEVLDLNIEIDAVRVLESQGVFIGANNAVLSPGEKWIIPYTINESIEPIFMEEPIGITINASWSGGTATIFEGIYVSLNTEEISEEVEEIVVQEVMNVGDNDNTQQSIIEETKTSDEVIQEPVEDVGEEKEAEEITEVFEQVEEPISNVGDSTSN